MSLPQKTSRITVDSSMDYVSASPNVLMLDFDSWAKNDKQSNAHQISRIDVLVENANLAGKELWLVEVKDFRPVAMPGGHQPGAASTAGISNTLHKKLQHTIAYICNSPDCPNIVRQMLPAPQSRIFAYHCEMPPPGTYNSAYFPADYPYTQFQLFKSKLPTGLVRKAALLNAAKINREDSIPWRVVLH